MRILLTNDDGYDAPGIRALWDAVRLVAEDAQIDIVAPAEAYSGKGHTVSALVRCRRVVLEGIGPVTVVEGTPGDCARMALALPGGQRPDWVISGINRGSNLGVDLYYSGTVAAAREAAILGIPGIAISQHVRPKVADDWTATAHAASTVLDVFLTPPDAPPGLGAVVGDQLRSALAQAHLDPRQLGGFWNINLPTLAHEDPVATIRLVPASTDPLIIQYEHCREGETDCLRYIGVYHDRPAAPGTDVATVFGGAIAVTRVQI